jgi:hypothetical protein
MKSPLEPMMTFLVLRSANASDSETRHAETEPIGKVLEPISPTLVRPWRRWSPAEEPREAFVAASALDFVALRDLIDGNPLR